jgi:DNA-binding transcriptional ArsR family regulator
VPETSPANAVTFAYSPVLEAVLSLSILLQPGHHPLHHEWARATRKQLPRELKQRLADYRFSHMRDIPAGLVPPPGTDHSDFGAELDRVRALSTEEKSRAIMSNLTSISKEEWATLDRPETRDAILDRSADLGSATVELIRLGFESPADLADRFLDFLAAYWEICFRADWERIADPLAETVAEVEETLATEGLFSILEQLRPRIGVNREAGEFWVRRAHDEAIAVGPDTQIQLVPSAFLWPHVGLVHDSPDRVAVIYPAPFAAFDSPPDLLGDGKVALLRALGDGTRLRALKLIAARPRSTQELAKLLAISESAMSRHLHHLAECGLLEVRRDGYYVLYSLVRDRIDGLSAVLINFLESD